MLTTRPLTRPLESYSAACSFDAARVSSSSSLLLSPQAKAAMTSSWSSLPPSTSYIPDHQPFSHQDPSNSMRVGYATRSATGALQRNVAMPEPTTMSAASLFANGATATNGGGMVRKKRRRYGPKPEPPYMCFCGKVFKRHEHMLRHRATHDDGIKYECHICGKCFRRQDVMHRHTMTHTSRSRLQSKMRTTASTTAAATQGRKSGEEAKAASSGRKPDQEPMHLGHAGVGHDVLEDPTLRVGLAEFPGTPTSARHNEDHHIAAAQLYSACNGGTTRYAYPPYAINLPPSHGADMAEPGYARSDSLSVMADYHGRMASSMSPPPPFFPPPAGLTENSFEPAPFGVALGRPQLGLTPFAGGEYEYEPKPNAHDAGHYAPGWHGGSYAFGHNSMHVGASESEWSEQSPSGPSTHTFASPAWSQKAELMRRDGAGSATGGTPSGASMRQLSMDPAARWYAQTHYQQGSPLLGNESGLPGFHRSPAHEPKRRLSTMQAPDGYSMAPDHAGKSDAHNETNGAGLGLFDPSQSHANETGTLGLVPTSTFGTGASAGGDRLSMLHHSPPHVSNGGIMSSSSHYLGAGLNSMHVSQGSTSQPAHLNSNSAYAGESKPSLPLMLHASETFDTGSPLTEATNASPKSHAFGSTVGSRDSMHPEPKDESGDALLDPHLGAGAHSGANGRRW